MASHPARSYITGASAIFLVAAILLVIHGAGQRMSTMGSGMSTTTDAGQQLRLNHIQVVGTHNSYHREITLAERPLLEAVDPGAQNLYYSHSSFEHQLSQQQVRSLEIDLHSDVKGGLYSNPLIWQLANFTTGPNGTAPFYDPKMDQAGLKVFHVTDGDTNSICHTFVACLEQLKSWSDAHPQHLPILIDLELKCDTSGCGIGGVCAEEAAMWNIERILNVDNEIKSNIPASKLITPDDVRQAGMTLEESILSHGWPTLESSRGKFMFYFDNDVDNITACSQIRDMYTANGHASLEDRVVFTNSVEGSPDAAFIKYNEPRYLGQAEIQRLVRKGYIVRTRSDSPIDTILQKDKSRLDAAWPSGAQIVSTDWPQYGMAARYDWDYVVQLDGGKVAQCNPVSAPEWCKDEMVQD